MQIRGVLFDKDGTLFDFDATWTAWADRLFRDLAHGDTAQAAVLGAAVGFDTGRQVFAAESLAVQGTPAEIAAALTPHLDGWSDQAIVNHLNGAAETIVPVGVVPLAPFLADLRARELMLGVATNDAYSPAMAHLAAAGIADAFDFLAGADSGHGAKPAPGLCRAFAEAMDLAPEAVVMVGDSPHDMIAGRRAGMRTVAVAPDAAARQALTPLADAVLASIAELPGWLDR